MEYNIFSTDLSSCGCYLKSAQTYLHPFVCPIGILEIYAARMPQRLKGHGAAYIYIDTSRAALRMLLQSCK